MSACTPPARVLMTTDAVGGVWQYSLELAAGLCQAGFEVWLAAMGPAPNKDQARSAGAISGLRLFHGDFRLEWMDNAEADLGRAGAWLLGLARDLRADLIHLNGYPHAALPWDRPVIVVAHSCVLSWWRAVYGCEAPDAWNNYRAFVQRGLDAADLVVAPSSAFLQTLRSIYQYEAPSCVIWNGRSCAAENRDDREKVVMTAGRLWDAAKNVGALAAIASSLPCPIWVAGDEAEHGIAGELVRLGRLSDLQMQQHLAKALIFALPARYEPFGLTALEAAQAGCALVLGDIPSQRELWDGAALFVKPDDTESLARILRRLLDEPATTLALATLARQRSYRFTAERMVERYLRAYALVAEELSSNNPAGGIAPAPNLHAP